MQDPLKTETVMGERDMRDIYYMSIWILSSTIVIISGTDSHSKKCHEVSQHCRTDQPENIPRCIEHQMKRCRRFTPRRKVEGYYSQRISYSEATLKITEGYVVHITSEAINKSRSKNERSDEDIDLIVSLLNKTFFMTNASSEVVHGDNVLGVWLGVKEIRNLSEPVQLRFKNTNQTEKGTCVYWNLNKKGEGNWSTEGCNTSVMNDEFVCSCNHLSFFAVLINPEIPEEIHIVHLSYISYVGSALSIAFTALVLVMFLWQRKKQSEKTFIIHVQLSGSLFLLHISFVCSVGFSGRSDKVCQSLGLILHWCLLATFSWTAIEGFHLYLLLVRVFNIYVRRYLLKLSLVAWGTPTVTVVICGIISRFIPVYGKYSIHEEKENTSICWITKQTVSFITVNGYLGLVMIFNTVILVVVLVKIHQLNSRDVQIGNKKRQVWKDWISVLGLCFALGIPWSLAFFTRVPLNLPALYMFTVLNSCQGVFIFLWFLTLTCKAREGEYISSKGTIHVSYQSQEEHVTTSVVNGKN